MQNESLSITLMGEIEEIGYIKFNAKPITVVVKFVNDILYSDS